MARLELRDFDINQEGYYTSKKNEKIRFDLITDHNGNIETFLFEIKVKPYFFGLIGKAKFTQLVYCSDFYVGLEFCLIELEKQLISKLKL